MRKSVVKVLCFLFPQLMTNLAYKKLTNPQIHKLRPYEIDFLETATKETLPFLNFTIQLYQWGNPQNESVLLIHGWEGQAGNFSDLIPKLLQQNYYVIAFDAPSHGFSSKGTTSLFEFSDLVAILIERFNCSKITSHSFGGVATTYALYRNPALKIDKYALLTTPDKFSQRIDTVADVVGISEKVKQRLIQRLEQEMNIDVQSIGVSLFVQTISVQEALIIHDKNDRVIPLEQSQNVQHHWKNCSLKVIEGTGHFRILRTESVLDDLVQFLS